MAKPSKQHDKGVRWLIRPGLLLACFLLFLNKPAAAQSAGMVQISQPETDKFPTVTFYMDAYDGQGSYINDLKANEVQVIENDTSRRPDNLSLQRPGVQFTVAMNLSPAFAALANNSNPDNPANFQSIQKRLIEWAKAQPDQNTDDISLTTNTGLQLIHQSNPTDWISALEAFKPDLTKSQLSLAGLSQALDLATDPNPRPQMKRAILFISPMLTPALAATLPNLTDRASQLGVHIYIWLITNEIKSDPKLVEPVQKMADQTGGRLIILTANDTLPNPDDFLKSMRSIYQVSYTSGITKAGSQKVSVNVKGKNIQATSQEKSFLLNILPPNPIFLAPPDQIQLSWTQPDNKTPPNLTPQSVTIPILIEFPDNHVRPLKQSSLYVDGVLESENTSAPFDKLIWKLDKYAQGGQTLQSGQHTLKVEIVDSLGFKQDSIDTPVELVIQPLSSEGIVTQVISNKWFPIGAGVLGAVSVTGLAGLAIRRRSKDAGNKPQKGQNYKSAISRAAAILHEDKKNPIRAATMSPTWPLTAARGSAPARLVQISENGHPLPDQIMSITHTETTLGRDPRQATCVIDLPSVNGLHARLFQTPEQDYYLTDCDSVAGTWVNYVLVPGKGVRLEHGDLIHIGKAAFRFELSNPPQIREPRVTEYKVETL